MATVTELRQSGASVTNVATPILEPIAAPEILSAALVRFGDNYNTSPNSHLFRFIYAICNEAGTGSFKKEMVLPRLASRLDSTHFLGLDRLFGNLFGLPRLSTETYAVDPETQNLTQAQWDDVKTKDSAYRERCLLWLRAIYEGPTKKGIQFAAEAALGVDCDVFEQYRYLDNPGTANYGQFTSRNEFVIVPRSNVVDEASKRRLVRLIDRLKPAGTISTLNPGTGVRTTRSILEVDSSSNRFYVARLVTGRTDVNWPTVDPSSGTWIQGGVEKEAPTYAFMDRQEAVTFLDVVGTTASSSHTGYFNAQQKELFANLSSTAITTSTYFDPANANPKTIAPLSIQQGWVNTSTSEAHDIIVANLSYPLSYFTINGVEASSNSSTDFWSSLEQLSPTDEWIMFDFGRVRPCNYLSFETTPKPFDFIIEYDDGTGTWTEINPSNDNDQSLSMMYVPAMDNPWITVNFRFDIISAERIRVTFTRRTDPFPLPTSNEFPYSIDIRGMRIMHVVTTEDGYVSDTGNDILGNAYRTSLVTYPASNVNDGTASYWQSKPNPVRNAVESLYFDLRVTGIAGLQSYLDTQTQDDFDTRSQGDMEEYYSQGQVVDEIYIDPVYQGASMHFYYSDDDTPEWDEKLWVPIPRSYMLRKGYHALPSPQVVKYFKIEFSNLTPIPYQTNEYPVMPTIEYNTYPTWVVNYFDTVLSTTTPTASTEITTIEYDPLMLFQNSTDQFGKTFEEMRGDLITTPDPEIQTQVGQLIANQIDTTAQTTTENSIRYNSTIMWQNDLMRQLNVDSALSRKAMEPRNGISDTGFNTELGLPAYVPPLVQSTSNLSVEAADKTQPTYWFPRVCRHGYKVMQATMTSKLAFVVAVREVTFERRNYMPASDEPIYIETMGDTAHIASSDFTLDSDGFYHIGQ